MSLDSCQDTFLIAFLVNGEGMANIKETNYAFKVGNQKQYLTWTYESSRAGNEEISLINDVLKQTNQHTIYPIVLRPKKDKEEQFYHQDCVAIFYYDDKKPLPSLPSFKRNEDVNLDTIIQFHGKNG